MDLSESDIVLIVRKRGEKKGDPWGYNPLIPSYIMLVLKQLDNGYYMVAWGHIFIYHLKLRKKLRLGLHSSQMVVENLYRFYPLNPKVTQSLSNFKNSFDSHYQIVV